jgi:hypothetical protein
MQWLNVAGRLAGWDASGAATPWRELGQLAGGLDYVAVGQAVNRRCAGRWQGMQRFPKRGRFHGIQS